MRNQEDVEKALENECKKEKRKFNANIYYEGLGLAGKFANFLKEVSTSTTTNKNREKQIISGMEIPKEKFAILKNKLLKDQIEQIKTSKNIFLKNSGNPETNTKFLDFIIDIDKEFK